MIARILNQLGRRIYVYRDYPSLIRGGHTFSIIRAAKEKIATHKNRIDIILVLNQDTINLHKDKLNENSVIIYDPEFTKIEGLTFKARTLELPIEKIVKEENASEIIRNTCILGAFIKAVGIKWEILDKIFREEFFGIFTVPGLAGVLRATILVQPGLPGDCSGLITQIPICLAKRKL